VVRRYEHQAVIERNGLYPYLAAFLQWTETKGCSKDTLKRRQSALRRFVLWCDERGLEHPGDITRPILERYQRHLYMYRKTDGRPLTYGSQNVLLTPLRTFFKWLARENHIQANPASELELPKRPKRLPRTILTVEEIEAVLALPDIETVEGLRDRAMLETLYSTGIRRAELAGLSVYDVDAKRQTLLVREGKGGQDRVVPIGARALHWVETYRLNGRPELIAGNDDGTLFLTATGQRFRRNVLTAKVKRYLRAAGVNKEGACHLFRHACATHMLDNGADIHFIQAILGHTDLSTTQIYTHVSIEKLKAVHAATHPAKAEIPHAITADGHDDNDHDAGDEDHLLVALAEEVRAEGEKA
jgi:integrase/recombinase XerD